MTAAQFKRLRRNLLLSQTKIGLKLGLCLRTIQRYEEGFEIPKVVELACKYLENKNG